MSSQLDAIGAARRYREANGAAILAEFADLLALPNVSRNLGDVARNASHIEGMLTARGVAARVVSRDGAGPIVIGRVDVPGAGRTIGVYAHYDGQPVDQPNWVFDPFSPTLCTAAVTDGGEVRALPGPDEEIDPEWRLYARSAADDKAPVIAMCAALDAMAAAGLEPTANLVFLFEGEEEIGSINLPGYLEELALELRTDAWLICDGPVHQTRRPQLVLGARGVAEIEITVYGPTTALHSGHYGNWAPNPAMLLAQLLASMKDEAGHVEIDGFYDGTAPITAEDEAAVAALPDSDDALRREFGLGSTEADGAPHALRMLIPSLNVRGMLSGGVGEEAANVVPASATASIDIRLALGNDGDEILDRVEAHIRAQGYAIVRDEPDMATRLGNHKVAKVDRKPSYPGFRTPVGSDLARALLAATTAAAGEEAIVMPTLGGSVPLHHFEAILGAQVAITPFANHDNSQHAANENLRVANLWYGIDLMTSLMTMPA